MSSQSSTENSSGFPQSNWDLDYSRRRRAKRTQRKALRLVRVGLAIAFASVLMAPVLSGCEHEKPSIAKAAPRPEWRLIWSDEFNGDTLDRTKWKPRNWAEGLGWSGFEDSPETIQVRDGVLHILARPRGNRYISGLVETQGLWHWHYGRFEARIKMAKGAGGTSAFWMMAADPTPEPWPMFGEIDIAEQLGRKPNAFLSALHYPNEPGGGDHKWFTSDKPLVDDFHVYRCDWTKDGFKFYIDGQLFHTITKWNPSDPAIPESPFHRNFFLILDLHVGSDWGGGPNKSTQWPLDMQVDWVRVYSNEDPLPQRKTHYE